MPDDPWFEEMDPMMYRYLYESWSQDLEDRAEFAKNVGIFVGSFSNYEMARSLSGDGVREYESSDEDFDKSAEAVLNDINSKEANRRMSRRRRRKIIEESTESDGAPQV